jgi:hypothetical protein
MKLGNLYDKMSVAFHIWSYFSVEIAQVKLRYLKYTHNSDLPHTKWTQAVALFATLGGWGGWEQVGGAVEIIYIFLLLPTVPMWTANLLSSVS